MSDVDIHQGTHGGELPVISEADFPALFRAADTESVNGQRSYLRAVRLQLVALVTAALFGVFDWNIKDADVAGIITAVAFGVSLVSEVYLLKEDPARIWYGGRALAESVKTLTWRYLAGGHPFAVTEVDPSAAERSFRERLGELLPNVPGIWLVPLGDQGQATQAMRDIRAQPLSVRRALYLAHRVRGQIDWYSRKALWNKRRAVNWSIAMAALTMVGMTAAVLKAAGIVNIDALGAVAALIAACGSWVQLKQHHNLVSAYSVAQHELLLIAEDVQSCDDNELGWANLVAQAEEAISREHTLWRASRF